MEKDSLQAASNKPVKVWRLKYIHLANKENDIKFHGPLSYRHLRILGWIFLIIAQIGTILGIAVNAKLIVIDPVLLSFAKAASSLMTPLFLFAAFSQMLTVKDGYRRLLRNYILGAVGIYLAFLVLFVHFGLRLFYSMSGDWNVAVETASSISSILNSSGGLAFNVFIDLVLCTLVTFFLNYHPSKYFRGKKIYIFRAFVAFPILYEMASILVKLYASADLLYVSPYALPLLTTKPPVAFLIFIALALFVKIREKIYIKRGKTHKDYKEFTETNVNRLHFSLFLVMSIVISVIIDVFLFFVVFAYKASFIPEGIEGYDLLMLAELDETSKLGFGGCLPMLLLIPVLIFFDYTKTYKNKMPDLIIPATGIAILALIYIEGFFEIINAFFIKMRNQTPQNQEPLPAVIKTIKNILRK